jgi:hypothetical protein
MGRRSVSGHRRRIERAVAIASARQAIKYAWLDKVMVAHLSDCNGTRCARSSA